VCTYTFLLHQESFDMILITNLSYQMGCHINKIQCLFNLNISLKREEETEKVYPCHEAFFYLNQDMLYCQSAQNFQIPTSHIFSYYFTPAELVSRTTEAAGLVSHDMNYFIFYFIRMLYCQNTQNFRNQTSHKNAVLSKCSKFPNPNFPYFFVLLHPSRTSQPDYRGSRTSQP
jgi:hypothetical protein